MTCKLYYCYGPVTGIILTCLLLNWLISSGLVTAPSAAQSEYSIHGRASNERAFSVILKSSQTFVSSSSPHCVWNGGNQENNGGAEAATADNMSTFFECKDSAFSWGPIPPQNEASTPVACIKRIADTFHLAVARKLKTTFLDTMWNMKLCIVRTSRYGEL